VFAFSATLVLRAITPLPPLVLPSSLEGIPLGLAGVWRGKKKEEEEEEKKRN
jgi:hypothetical protein